MKHLYLYPTVLATLCILSCGRKTEEPRIETLSVQTETAAESTIALTKSYVGEVEAESSTVASFTSMGTVVRIYVSEGERVKTGQVIAQMDDTQNRHALSAAQSTLLQAQDAYDRMKKLHDSQSLSDMDWVNVQSKLQQAQSALDMAQRSLEECTLKAPCSGIIGKKQMEAGQTALPAQPVCEILDIHQVKVRISIPEQEIRQVTPDCTKGEGVPIRVTALGDETFYSHAYTKGVQGDALTHTYDVLFELSNPDRALLPGMVAQVELPSATGTGRSPITLPIRSIQQSADGQPFVWLNLHGKAHRAPVSLGSTWGNRIEVLSGIQKGDEVIVAGYQKVSEGSPIQQPSENR